MSIPTTMRAAVAYRPGPPRFELATTPTPAPGPGQVLIRVHACSVNFSDVKRRRGDVYPFPTAFPYVPGGEVAGEIVAHGPGVTAPPVGTKVFALAGADGSGGCAQFALAYAAAAVPIPAGLSMEAASALTIAGTTAKLLIDQVARVQPGDTVLVSAAAGGVGSFAIQLAKRANARTIIAAIGSASKRQHVLDLGAHVALDTSSAAWPALVREHTAGRGVDVALESLGGSALEATLECLAPFGRLVVFGAASGQAPTRANEVLERLLYSPALNQSLLAFNLGGWFMERPAVAGQALTELVTAVLAGDVTVPPLTRFPLGELARAHELLERRQNTGKLVITPWT